MDSYGTIIPLSAIEKYYMAILSAEPPTEIDANQPLDLELDQFSLLNWEKYSPLSHDFLENVLPSDEAIMEVMALTKQPWENLRPRSSFLPNKERVET